MTALPVLAVIFAAAVVISVSVAVRSWRRRAGAAGFGAITVLAAGAGWWMVVLSGITNLRMYARNPRRYRGHPYRELIRTMSDLVVVVDGRGRVVDHNPAAGRLLALLERDAAEIFGELPSEDAEFSVTDIAGTGIDLSVRVSVLDTSATRLLVARDVTEQNRQRLALEEANDQLRTQLEIIEILRGDLAEQAVRDELTGLHNRRHLMAELTARVEVRSSRWSSTVRTCPRRRPGSRRCAGGWSRRRCGSVGPTSR